MEESPNPCCPLCLQTESSLAFEAQGFSHRRCRGCGTLYLHPAPSQEDLEALYRSETKAPQCQGCWDAEPVHMRSLWRRVLGQADRLVGKGPLLDVGCGSGHFLSFARQQGWEELHGLEIAPVPASRAREASAATIHEQGFLQHQFGDLRFHLITLWSVFEHFAWPDALLKRCRQILTPGGVLVLDTPHGQGLSLRLFKEKTVVVTPPEHIVYPSIPGMKSLLERAHFSPKALETSVIYLGQLASTAHSLGSTQENASAAYTRWYTRLTQSSVFLFATHVVNALLRLLRLGDQLTVVAVKR